MNKKTHSLVLTALLIALVLLLGLTPLGMIPLGFINISLLSIPVSVAVLTVGLKQGMITGFAFGTVSALSAFGIVGTPSSLAATLVAASPALALLMCYVPRLLIPAAVWAVNRMTSKNGRTSKKALPLAAAAGSLCNTVFYLGLMLLFYVLMGLDNSRILALIGGTGLIAGACEAVAAAIIVTPVVIVVRKGLKE